MHHENLGAKVSGCLYDNRFTSLEQRILGTIEVDMNNNGVIVTFFLYYIVNNSTLHKDIRIWIKSWGKENLLICTRFVGRFNESSIITSTTMNYRCS